MSDEQYEKIIERLNEQLEIETVGSEKYKAIAEQLREFEKLRQSNEQVLNDYVRLCNEEDKYKRECEAEEFKARLESNNEFREQMVRLALGVFGGGIVIGLTYFSTVFLYENPVTNRSAASLASTAMSRWLTKLF